MVSTLVSIPGYSITEELYNGLRTLVYRGVRETDSLPVVIKLLKNPYPTFGELLSFRNQYTIAKNLNSPLIIQTYSLQAYQNGYALVMEDFGGISLQEWVVGGRVESLMEFLEIAIALCKTLDILYQERIIHKDIKPANILINPETKQVKLIDFSIASLLPRETQTLINPNVLEGTLAYISPEQTGRMNRGIDYRSDYYALGVTFYELLTGVLPFPSKEPMELVHCHIAQMAPLAHRINVNIPLVLSEIIHKLMAKNAEDRYQNMLGLQHDLEICLQQLITTDNIEYFEIGQRDISDRFIIPDKLYGREAEVSTLLQAFERVSLGATEMMLVAGFSGIGKTAVVNEVHKPIVRQRGYFIKGKYDQFQRNIPFSAFVQAFRSLMAHLLSESDTQLQLWKSQILAALGDSAQVIIEVIPELERIIGVQPPAIELSGTAAQNRFNLLFQKFIQIFTTIEHPLVMFLDDLQWADSASLNLIQVLMAESTTGYLLLLGAYRDNEVFAAHPLMLTLDTVSKAGDMVNTITLEPLSQSSLNHLVADTLNCAEALAQPLTELVMQKTQGNPFFATQFLKALHQEKLITFDINAGYWQCNIVRVREAALTDDVVEFMALQLQKLPDTTQNILKLAACIGAEFDLQTLAIVLEQSQTEVATALWKALQEGLILPQSEVYKFYLGDVEVERSNLSQSLNYQFLHDRVQQAAYSLIPDDQKQITHLAIARLLHQSTPETELEANIFEIVNHWNRVINLILDPQEKKNLAQLNLIAGSKAKASTANEPALTYFQTGLTLLSDESWQTEPHLTLALHEGAAEAAYLCGNSDQMEEWIGVILSQNLQPTKSVKAYTIQIQAYTTQGRYQEAIAIARTALAMFNIQLPEQPTPEYIAPAIQEVTKLLTGRTTQDLLNLPVMTEAETLAIMELLASITVTTYVSAPLLFPFIILTQVKLSINKGNTALSALAYNCYGTLSINLLGDLDAAYNFGQLSLQLAAKLNARLIQTKVLNGFAIFIVHCKSYLRDSLPIYIEGFQTALEVGDLEFLGHNTYGICQYSYHMGKNLTSLIVDTKPYLAILSQHNLTVHLNYSYTALLPIQRLQGSQSKAELATQGKQLHHSFTIANDLTGLHFYWVGRLTVSYLFDETVQASEDAAQARQTLTAGGAGLFSEFVFYFYDSLTAIAEYPEATDKTGLGDRIAANQAKLQHRANHAPMNFQHKYDLVEAEQYRVFNQKYKAADWYDRAISGAKANEYIQEEGLANELAAKFYLDWGKEKIAAVYMQEAYYCYAKWGAKAKIDDLKTRYPHLLRPILESAVQPINVLETLASIGDLQVSLHSSTISSHSSSTRVNSALDFAAILKASQSLAGTIQLNELLHQLTQVILQNSGGDCCALILPNENQVWEVRAIATPTATDLYSDPLENNPNLPIKLIQYVKNTQQVVVLDDLETNLPIIDDYLRLDQPKSVLCLPILNQGHLVGILYLKNRCTSGVFTSDRLLILNFLCTQAAISLENARLYSQVQQTLTDLQQAQLQIIQSEKMSALGNLVAGVAHEINNPIGFIAGNLNEANHSLQDLIDYVHLYQEKFPEPGREVVEKAEEIDLDYLIEDLPKMLESMQTGCDRIKFISKSLRTFSRSDTDRKQFFDIHEGIDSTVLILRHRLKANEQHPAIEVVTNYGNLPLINCFPGQLNQVFMNILANAIDALEESSQGRSFTELKAHPNLITITTTVVDRHVQISIMDNGKGMSEEVKNKVFEHLFTTKGVSKGTGLGLAIARQIIVEKHNGSLFVNSTLGEGSEFVITLPIQAGIPG
ncbi:trifunctional serine/threonine-protein kinase/ATP-binding protein/sensor histidine kinase [Anabaena catenula]|uniref:histidine kinase n=1 Tax=Anabaena catenula FACHB-362 TaxID=2692877 RepID=A0ABR8J4R2_9NOST|nr:ATP-binding sensor histidine kinase [Anabaena catenula]MBD2692464.1 AAA family ATPase [Anabaena catenula FACHB-362]